jgi:hypothetical protein
MPRSPRPQIRNRQQRQDNPVTAHPGADDRSEAKPGPFNGHPNAVITASQTPARNPKAGNAATVAAPHRKNK